MHLTSIDPLEIYSQQGNYPVSFHTSITDGISALGTLSEAYVVIDSEVFAHHRAALAGLAERFPTLILDATENTKSLVGVARLVNWLIEQRAVRSCTVVAVGGGTIQDLVSFTAHIYYRGVDWVFLPTTVLSQADSCIGAKSGINVLPFKNQLGVLHSPRQVRICAEFLDTLRDLEFASGYGEIVKLAVTSSKHFLPLLEISLAEGGLRNTNLLRLEHAALMAKQAIIEEDEYESDLRRVLNYGHSFGHALESISKHQVPHGLGVLWGIDVINSLGVMWGVTPLALAQRMHELIEVHFSYELPLLPEARSLVDMLRRDKKVAQGKMHFAVLKSEGNLVILPRALDNALIAQVGTVLSGDSDLGKLVFGP